MGKICGEANEVVFIGLTDLFQAIANYFVPDVFPLTLLEAMFNDTFDNLQENMKPFAYNQGVAMGDKIEADIAAWISNRFDAAMAELEALRDQLLTEINKWKDELEALRAQIANELNAIKNAAIADLEALRAQLLGQIDVAKAEIDALRSQTLAEINIAKNKLLEHAQKIQDQFDTLTAHATRLQQHFDRLEEHTAKITELFERLEFLEGATDKTLLERIQELLGTQSGEEPEAPPAEAPPSTEARF